jgi:hypothetical protein
VVFEEDMGLEVGFHLGPMWAVRAGEGDGVEGMLGVEMLFHVPGSDGDVGAVKAMQLSPAVDNGRCPVLTLLDVLDPTWERKNKQIVTNNPK